MASKRRGRKRTQVDSSGPWEEGMTEEERGEARPRIRALFELFHEAIVSENDNERLMRKESGDE